MKTSLLLKIWFHPRASVRSAIEKKSMDIAIYLAILTGMIVSFHLFIPNSAKLLNLPPWIKLSFYLPIEEMSILSLLIIVGLIGVMIGLISWFITAIFILGIGKIWKGKVRLYELLIALGVALIPIASTTILWGLNLLVFGKNLFILHNSNWLIFSNIFTTVLAMWSLYLMVIAIFEVYLSKS